MGDWEQVTPVIWESSLGYHPWYVGILTGGHYLVTGQCQADSLTGAVASERVTEALKGWLSTDGNRAESVNAEVSLTATPTGGAVTKVGVSDPAE